ncbi:MAG: histidine phosphatase family protein [Thalassotalea sp.]
MKTKFYLARHGETLWNKEQRFQGQLDSDLTCLGKEQSQQVARRLADKSIDLIISSALGRAVATAQICQNMLTVKCEINNKLSERNLGAWQGQQLTALTAENNYDEILHKFTDVAPIGGESAIKCGERMLNAITTISQKNIGKSILVIFHGEALRCLLLLLGQRCQGNAYRLFANGCLWELSYDHDKAEFQYAMLPI